MSKDPIGDRMKANYENIYKQKMVRRMPVIIRIDGKAFHSFTRGFKKPFDNLLNVSMENTMSYLCNNIQGCKLGFTQSDEISLLLTDYNKLTSEAWFDNYVQKICSVSASMATMAFNRIFISLLDDFKEEKEYEKYKHRAGSAMFDARAFNVPK